MNHSLPDQCPTCGEELDYWAENYPGEPGKIGWGCCSCEQSGAKYLTTLDQERYPTCPVCDSDPADVSWQTAGNQNVCPNADCSIVSWVSSDDDQEVSQ